MARHGTESKLWSLRAGALRRSCRTANSTLARRSGLSKHRNLAAIYEEFLTALVRFSSQPAYVDAERFRLNMTELLDQARTTAQNWYEPADVKMADIVASAFL